MIKRICILIIIFISTVYSSYCLTNYLSVKGEDRSYNIYESKFNEMQDKLDKKDSLTTNMSEQDIKAFSQLIVKSEKKNDEDIKPRFMKMFNEKTKAFSKELAKKQILRGNHKEKEVKIADKSTMNGYLEEARDDIYSENEDQLHYFVKAFVDIQNSFDGYKIKTSENLLSFFLIAGFSILLCIFLFIAFAVSSGDLDFDIECMTIITYGYLFVSVFFYIIYLLGDWLCLGV